LGERFYLMTGHVTWGDGKGPTPAFCRGQDADGWVVDEADARRAWALHRDELIAEAATRGAVPWAVAAYDGR
jgi:hypothetical protein